MAKSGARLLIETLVNHGVDRFFCVPGESYLKVMDELVDDPALRVVTCRHEGGAAFMATADARATGKPAVVFASRGPGATNASIAIHSAMQGAVPLIVCLGQVSTPKLGRGGLQEMDFGAVFGPMCKRVEQVQDPGRIGEIVARAFQVATTGTPGPVVIGLPTDMLTAMSDKPAGRPRATPRALASDADLGAVAEALGKAERPVLIAGSLANAPEARAALQAVSERYGVPVMTSYTHQDLFPNGHPHWGGELGIRPPKGVVEAAKAADLVLAVGTRMLDMTSQGFTIPGAGQRLIHVFPDPEVIGVNFETALGLVAEPGDFLARLAARNAPPAPASRAAWIARANDGYRDGARLLLREGADGIDFGWMIKAMIDHVPDDAVITCDAGNFTSWLTLQYPFKATQTLIASEAGAMGMGIPAAVAAAIRYPGRQVVGLAGDGGALMTGNELATAVKERAKVRLIIANNAHYGTIRLHQEMHHPRRVHGANDLVNPDFAAWGRAFGAAGFTVSKPEEAGEVLRAALAADGPAVIDVKTSLENIVAVRTMEEVRG